MRWVWLTQFGFGYSNFGASTIPDRNRCAKVNRDKPCLGILIGNREALYSLGFANIFDSGFFDLGVIIS